MTNVVSAALPRFDYGNQYRGACQRAWNDYVHMQIPRFGGSSLGLHLDVVRCQSPWRERILQISYMNNGGRFMTKQNWTQRGVDNNAQRGSNPGQVVVAAVLEAASGQRTEPWAQWLAELLAQTMEPISFTPPGTAYSVANVWDGKGDHATPGRHFLLKMLFVDGGGSPKHMAFAVSVFLHALMYKNSAWDNEVERCLDWMAEARSSPSTCLSLHDARNDLPSNRWLYSVLTTTPERVDHLKTHRDDIRARDDWQVEVAKDFLGCFVGLMCAGLAGGHRGFEVLRTLGRNDD